VNIEIERSEANLKKARYAAIKDVRVFGVFYAALIGSFLLTGIAAHYFGDTKWYAKLGDFGFFVVVVCVPSVLSYRASLSEKYNLLQKADLAPLTDGEFFRLELASGNALFRDDLKETIANDPDIWSQLNHYMYTQMLEESAKSVKCAELEKRKQNLLYTIENRMFIR
jgi:hypothetical protein